MTALPRRHPLTIRYTVLGDSLGFGTGATRPEHGFTASIYRALARQATEHSFENLSVPGATINDVLAWQVTRIPSDSTVIALVAGSNDVPNAGDPAHFGQEYGRLLGRIRAAAPGARLYVAGIPNIAVTLLVPEEVKPTVAALCSMLSTEIEMQASTHQAQFIDLFGITSRARGDVRKYLADDGFHPSDRGYALMARGALRALGTDPFDA